eukprot:4567708-Ditylum_brightwellii.AAC.1
MMYSTLKKEFLYYKGKREYDDNGPEAAYDFFHQNHVYKEKSSSADVDEAKEDEFEMDEDDDQAHSGIQTTTTPAKQKVDNNLTTHKAAVISIITVLNEQAKATNIQIQDSDETETDGKIKDEKEMMGKVKAMKMLLAQSMTENKRKQKWDKETEKKLKNKS